MSNENNSLKAEEKSSSDTKGKFSNEPNTCEHNTNLTNVSFQQPVMRMSKSVHTDIIFEICSRPAEAGGILLGPIDSNDITEFFYDKGADCSGVTYSPDYITLRQKMKEEWMPSGIDMKGFAHSHPGKFDCHSKGDLTYIARLLEKNPEMEIFFAPIIIPSKYWMRPLCILRSNPNVSHEAKLVLF